MTPFEIAFLVAIAALAYQEIWWRDRARRMESGYHRRLCAERAIAYSAGADAEDGPVRAFTFYAEKLEPSGLFREVARPLFIVVTLSGNTVLHAAGDLAEMSRFDMPPAIRKSLTDYVAPQARVSAA
jgi:hypothetical protein